MCTDSRPISCSLCGFLRTCSKQLHVVPSYPAGRDVHQSITCQHLPLVKPRSSTQMKRKMQRKRIRSFHLNPTLFGYSETCPAFEAPAVSPNPKDRPEQRTNQRACREAKLAGKGRASTHAGLRTMQGSRAGFLPPSRSPHAHPTGGPLANLPSINFHLDTPTGAAQVYTTVHSRILDEIGPSTSSARAPLAVISFGRNQ